MSRLTPYLGIVAALATGVIIAIFSGGLDVGYNSEAVITPSAIFPPTVTGSVTATSSRVTAVSDKKAPLAQASVVSESSVRNITAELDVSAKSLRDALVNIICSAPVKSKIHSISGSGVFIDSKGIILTNAHIGQYFLMADRGVSCVIRSGSPAVAHYKASIIYISPVWIQTNPNVLTQTNAIGNGEYDFALLAVSGSAVSNDIVPSSFPYLPLATFPPPTGAPVAIASYGAQFLASDQIQSGLFPTIVFGSVKEVFTFGTNTIDVLALGGSYAAQEGSSGGGVVDTSGALVGTITTSTVSGTTDTRSLDAITASYIRAQYASETGHALDILLTKPTKISVADFAPKIPALESIITAQLP